MSIRKFELINWLYSVSFSNFPKRLAAWALLSLSCLLMCLVSMTGILGSVRSKEIWHCNVKKIISRELSGI